VSIKLANQTQKAAGIPNGLRTATVASLDSDGIMLSINGGVVGPFACVDTMLPEVGDVVSVFRQDSSWLIIGRATLDPSPWVTLTLLNSWTGTLAVRMVRGAGKSMQIFGAFPTLGTKADNTQIAQLSDPYIPLRSMDVAGTAGITVAGGQTPHFFISTAGAILCQGYSAAANGGMQAIVPLDLA
jgi:hypothetical protein